MISAGLVGYRASVELDPVCLSLAEVEKAHQEGPGRRERRDDLRAFLTYDATRSQHTHGDKAPGPVSPDAPAHDQSLLDREG